MADGTVPYQNPTTTDGLLDCESLTVAAQTVKRERVQVSGATDVALASVSNASPTTEYGLVVRNIPSGTQPVSGTVAATQSGVWNIGTLTSITNPVAVTGTFFQATQPVSAVALPLPTGATTLAEQQAQTTALQLIDNIVSGAGANITQLGGVNVSLNTGVRDAGTVRVTVATNDVVPASQSGTWNIGTVTNLDVALSTRLAESTFTTRINTQGQKTMAASTPVVLASDQASIPVTMTSTTITGSVAVTGPLTDAQLRATPVPISGTVTASSSATATASDPLYVEATANAFSQDLAGNLRVRVRGMVSDTVEGLYDGTYRDLSLTNDGRLRVSAMPARYQVPFFSDNEEQMWGPDLQVAYAFSGSPWSEW